MERIKDRVLAACLALYELMRHVALRPYPTVFHRITAIAAMDAILYAAFAVVVGIPLSLLGVRCPGIVLFTLGIWLGLDAVACYAYRKRDR